uniref:7-cyano-7-deazaguanine reductase QueF n=1 Tax=Dinoroseobacter phage vB_DshS_R26L TaxID=3161158 RepID=A0AAU7VHW6_9CAUD
MNEQLSDPEVLKSLGSGSSDFDGITEPADARLLEAFPNPMAKVPGHAVIQLGGYDDPKEFTSLCPKTGQPDFARIVVEYTPRDLCVESKSWKLYLGSYRTAQEFHEACVARILRDLVALLDPAWIRVTGEFTPRGGISINPTMEYERGDDSSMPEPT